jgi:hypothetical protein
MSSSQIRPSQSYKLSFSSKDEKIKGLPTNYDDNELKGVNWLKNFNTITINKKLKIWIFYLKKLTKYLVFSLVVAAFGAAFQFGWSIAILNTSIEVRMNVF